MPQMADGPTPPKRLVHCHKNPRDAELEHPKLDRTALMRKAEFGDITGQTDFERADYVTCQLEKKDNPGKPCERRFGNGWIMANSDGVEGYIGGDCADEHFGAHEAFAGAKAKARREVALQETVKQLRGLLDDAPSRRTRLSAAIERHRQIMERVRRLREALPFATLERLSDAAKSGRREVALEFETPEPREDEKTKKVYTIHKWKREPFGYISSPAALDAARLKSIADRLREAGLALTYAEASLEQKVSQMRDWAQAINGLDDCERDIVAASADLNAFSQPENLRMLCWLCRDESDQEQCAGIALQTVSRDAVKPAEAKRARRQWYQEIVAAKDGRRFRVP